jgi:Helitron helicase-like domain at N-terminus
VVFPDGDMPQPSNGGFGTQDKFREFLMKHDNGQWNSRIQSKPTQERIQDYDKDVIAQAFPLQFPFGYSGLPGDQAYEKMVEKNGKTRLLCRKRVNVLRKLLQHRKACFHSPEFNLIVENVIMKQTIFESAQLNCNVKGNEGVSMAEKYGKMSSKMLEGAIHANRKKNPTIHSSKAEYQFLKSVTATCRSLPHTNEAAVENRKIYFSFLMKFGLPCIFLTVTPDDNRCFRIILYLLKGQSGLGLKPEDMTDAEILADFKFRQESRLNYPGLCAEEYSRIMNLVIKHVFGWDIDSNKSYKGMGLFGEVMAWCLATEEQGRKTLHGHFLIFLKNWNQILSVLQKQGNHANVLTYNQAWNTTRMLYENVCSANLFKDFVPVIGVLNSKAVFFHECSRRKHKAARFAVDPADDQERREQRHKRMCQDELLKGKLGSCRACQKVFTVSDVVTLALKTHMGAQYAYPDWNRRLEASVYTSGQDLDWMEHSLEDQAMQYFAANALVNLHNVTHASRCFKKGSECYANLPEPKNEHVTIIHNEEYDVWSDWMGLKQNRQMFKISPQRGIEDAFMNTHNRTLTLILGCNTNVMVAMNGCSVFYVTGYNAKSNQKEETAAFEVISEVVVKHLEKQVCSGLTI